MPRELRGGCKDDNQTYPTLYAVSLVMKGMTVVMRCLDSGNYCALNGYSTGDSMWNCV